MTEVLFYHLTESTLEQTLPGLLERSLQRGWKAVVQAGSMERLDALDAHLWTFRDDAFLAHGRESDLHAAEQPILLTTGTGNPNGADIRFFVDGASPPEIVEYKRVIFLFDGHDAAQLEGARRHWKEARAQGHAATYWQQSAERGWEQKR
jgi:DNA polymerase-3 subunit chi